MIDKKCQQKSLVDSKNLSYKDNDWWAKQVNENDNLDELFHIIDGQKMSKSYFLMKKNHQKKVFDDMFSHGLLSYTWWSKNVKVPFLGGQNHQEKVFDGMVWP